MVQRKRKIGGRVHRLACFVGFLFTLALLAPGAFGNEAPKGIADAIVMVESHWPDGKLEKGAGIIVGFDSKAAVIATANHVIRDVTSNFAVASSIRVRFSFDRDRERNAAPITHEHRDLDVSVIVVPVDAVLFQSLVGINFQGLSPSSQVHVGASLRMVGNARGQGWFLDVEASPVVGISNDTFTYRASYWESGYSGGALIDGRGGIVGLIVRGVPPYGTGVWIDKIRELALAWGSGPFLIKPTVRLAGRGAVFRIDFVPRSDYARQKNIPANEVDRLPERVPVRVRSTFRDSYREDEFEIEWSVSTEGEREVKVLHRGRKIYEQSAPILELHGVCVDETNLRQLVFSVFTGGNHHQASWGDFIYFDKGEAVFKSEQRYSGGFTCPREIETDESARLDPRRGGKCKCTWRGDDAVARNLDRLLDQVANSPDAKARKLEFPGDAEGNWKNDRSWKLRMIWRKLEMPEARRRLTLLEKSEHVWWKELGASEHWRFFVVAWSQYPNLRGYLLVENRMSGEIYSLYEVPGGTAKVALFVPEIRNIQRYGAELRIITNDVGLGDWEWFDLDLRTFELRISK